MTNPTSHAIQWGIRHAVPWLLLTPSNGYLPVGGSTTVSTHIDAVLANLLPVGTYSRDVMFRGNLEPAAILQHFELHVLPASSALNVSPSTDFVATGPAGGPFVPTSTTYTLTNLVDAPLGWVATLDQPWVEFANAASGTLPLAGTANLNLRLDDSTVSSMGSGTYTAHLSIKRTSSSIVLATRQVSLTIEGGPSPSGWTEFEPSSDTRRVYVSATGNDANNGLSETTPKRTIAAGKSLMRHGYPDWLLLKTGDTWNEALGHWAKSGRSALEPMLISSYGASDVRPYLRTGSSDGVTALAAGGSPPTISHVSIVGIHFFANSYNGTGAPSGINWMIDSDNLLVEDCWIEGYQINVAVPGYGGHKRNVKVRRNIIVDSFATTGTVGHGIYMANADHVLIEENVLDKNGWNSAIPGALPSIFRHGIYIQSGSGTCTDVTVRGNIISESSSHGLHLRPGGTAEDNLFLRNSIALSLGGGNEPNPGGVAAIARGNVILDGKNIDASNPRGWGIDMANINSATVSYNIVANLGPGLFPIPMTLYGDSNGMGVHSAAIEHNVIWNWGGSVSIQGNSTQITSIGLRFNDIADLTHPQPLMNNFNAATVSQLTSASNRFASGNSASTWMRCGSTNYSLTGWKALVGDTTSSVLGGSAFPSPNRTIATYQTTIGGIPTHAGFMTEARKQSKANWRTPYTARGAIQYFREGFGLVVP